ncbi:MAG TPA: type II secretion system ATPase GspE [Haliangiales bacterium]|nr:type II secretion system ATPase GspE [Haliangiales bacterium]
MNQERYIGQILIRDLGMRPELLDKALEEQAQSGGLLGEILLRQKAIRDEDLARALAIQMGLPYLAELPRAEDVDPDLLEKLPVAFAKQQHLLPLRREGDAVVVALANPLAVHALDDVRALLGLEALPAIAAPARILDLINKVFARLKTGVELADQRGEEGDEFGDAEELVDILDLTDEAPIIRWVNSLIFQAVKERASDIHIEPGERDVVVRYRIDGVLREAKRAHRQYMPSILSRVKIMAGLNIAEKRLPQDGRIRRKIAGKDIDMRVATAPIANGERVTIRLLDRSSVLLGLADIGFASDHLAELEQLINRPHGIFLVTGPTGSGKTTTLYACLARINSPDLNILTIEDPVEYQLEGISQTQVNPKIDLTFASGLRSFLRHDPDVIMVGEIRDIETAEIAIQASLTGHLVFSTVHTNDAAGAITRLEDMGVEPFLVTSSVLALMAQRLVRRICPHCRHLYAPRPEEIEALGLHADAFYRGTLAIPELKGGVKLPPGKVFRAKGCHACLDTGYTGRTGIYELLHMSDEVRTLALKKEDANIIKRAAVAKGMRTLRLDGAYKVLAGMTTIEEVMLVTAEDVV